jgi:PmbA protein
VTNSSGGSAGASASTVALATSAGFSGARTATGFSCSVAVIAGEGGAMQRDHAWHSARHLADLDPADDRKARRRARGRPAASRQAPVGPDAGAVRSASVAHPARPSGRAISGSSVARKSSFLQDKLGSRIFGEGVAIIDDPLRLRGFARVPFDGEGVRVKRTEIVSDGVLQTWMAESASARQLKIAPTGHRRAEPEARPACPQQFLHRCRKAQPRRATRRFPEALLVTELIGHGVNPVTGDYSRGAAGFLVRNGEIGPAVQEITIASNLIDMFATLEPGVGPRVRRGIDAPTLLVPEMTVWPA